ncbi:hypothetical protein BN1221_00066c [Brenneria goodwinii]|uniref:Uncharacterized protein n=1 Tax=Brenneria goodwinii TaxID=1109412 RepID=A0A0G4JP40_9GAMM|nr:hypothetical protein BN1221_00066c [Brenneria goodwinii]
MNKHFFYFDVLIVVALSLTCFPVMYNLHSILLCSEEINRNPDK